MASPAAPRRAVRDQARRDRLHTTLTALGDTEVGRELGLGRLTSLDDFRATIPLHDAVQHSERVTARLGFGLDGIDAELLTAAKVEREAVHAVWRERLAGARPTKIAVLQAHADDPLVDRLRLDDLRALGSDPAGRGPELLRLDSVPEDPEQLMVQLRRFGPDMLVTPSLATCAWLEQVVRAPLERRLPQLRWLVCEHDLDERLRSRRGVINAGWLHPAGRVGLPGQREPWDGFTLAARSTLIELLPHGDPEIDPRQPTAERTLSAKRTLLPKTAPLPKRTLFPEVALLPEATLLPEVAILPEAAIVGQRYELILTSPLGFLRLRSGLHVRVIGFAPPTPKSGYDLPRARVVRLPQPPADAALEGVTLAGAWLTASVRQAFLPEDPALVAADVAADPDAVDVSTRDSRMGLNPFADTELGASRAGSRREGPKPRSLVVRLEVQGQSAPNFAVSISGRIDRDLRTRSAAYDWLRGRDELWEPRVVIARAGTARRERDRRVRSLSGSVARPVVRML